MAATKKDRRKGDLGPIADPSRVALARKAVHLTGEGLKGLAISPGQTLACIVSLAVAACLITLFGSFGSLAVSVLDRAGQRARVLVYLKEEVPSASVEALIRRVRARPDVERVEYVSREQDRARNSALLPRDLVERLPADAVPGQHCLEVTFREDPSRPPDVASLSAFMRAIEGVDVVAEPPVGAARIRSAAGAVGFGRLVLTLAAVLLLASTIFFVVGTLTRTMERRREEMGILRLVGATNAFIRVPLFVQGIVQGVVGVGLGAVAALVIAGAANAWIAGTLGVGVRVPLHPVATLSLALLVGAGVGAFGAFVASIRRLP